MPQSGWLTRVGPYKCEHLPCPGPDGGLIGTGRPKGVQHTTEGTFESAVAVFRVASAPTFLVGRDSKQRIRIVQTRALGECAAALEHPAGTPETNRAVAAQVELVAFSKHEPWLPDAEVTDALAHLYLALREVAGIPLRHVHVKRDEKIFARASGWIGHADVPNNHHWDPGELKWAALFERCRLLDAPRPVIVKPKPRRIDVLVNGRLRLRGQRADSPAVAKRVTGWIKTAAVLTVRRAK